MERESPVFQTDGGLENSFLKKQGNIKLESKITLNHGVARESCIVAVMNLNPNVGL